MNRSNRPKELERRLRLLENIEHQGDDIDRLTWCWIGILGGVVPAILIAWGWS